MRSAAEFDKQMAEVRTLLPNAGKDFANLDQQVQRFSNRTGQAANDVVPALYQALSAGVPPGNVFDFLDVANQAAVGGVTDITTAVDGLTSVVNAFGPEAISAERAADIMFATVRGGKTTFEELSASLFQINPLAAAAGVSFEEVGAAMAALTAQGVPTAQAATQMRGAIQGLTRPTKELSEIFRAAGFESGEAAIRQIGFAEAANIVQEATGGSVSQLTKLVGSIEGVQAILGITGANAETFAGQLEAMENATGAAGEAFRTVAESDAYQLEQAMNRLGNASQKLGGVILPELAGAMEIVAGATVLFSDALEGNNQIVGEANDSILTLIKNALFPAEEATMDVTEAARNLNDQDFIDEQKDRQLQSFLTSLRETAEATALTTARIVNLDAATRRIARLPAIINPNQALAASFDTRAAELRGADPTFGPARAFRGGGPSQRGRTFGDMDPFGTLIGHLRTTELALESVEQATNSSARSWTAHTATVAAEIVAVDEAEQAARRLTDAETEVARQLRESGLESEYLEQALGFLEDQGIVPIEDAWGDLIESVRTWGEITGGEIAGVIGRLEQLRAAQRATQRATQRVPTHTDTVRQYTRDELERLSLRALRQRLGNTQDVGLRVQGRFAEARIRDEFSVEQLQQYVAGTLGGQPFGEGVPLLQAGGIVRRPTLAMIGEAGPEAVIPLGRGGGLQPVTVNINGDVYAQDGYAFGDRVAEALRRRGLVAVT